MNNAKKGGSLYGGVLTDTLYDPMGAVISTRSWDIGKLLSREQITLTYSVAFGTSTLPGIYRNVARITGKQGYNDKRGKEMTPVEAVGNVQFTTGGEVLGVSVGVGSGSSCAPILFSSLAQGASNSVEVMALQRFLAREPGVYPQGLVTGYFGPLTAAGVTAFQRKYGFQPTSSVDEGTKNKINELACIQGAAPAFVAPPVLAPAAPLYPPAPASFVPKPKPAPTPAPKPAPAAAVQGGWFSSLFKGVFGGN